MSMMVRAAAFCRLNCVIARLLVFLDSLDWHLQFSMGSTQTGLGLAVLYGCTQTGLGLTVLYGLYPDWSGTGSSLWALPRLVWDLQFSMGSTQTGLGLTVLYGLYPDWSGTGSSLWVYPDWSGTDSSLWALPRLVWDWQFSMGSTQTGLGLAVLYGLYPDWSGTANSLWALPRLVWDWQFSMGSTQTGLGLTVLYGLYPDWSGTDSSLWALPRLVWDCQFSMGSTQTGLGLPILCGCTQTGPGLTVLYGCTETGLAVPPFARTEVTIFPYWGHQLLCQLPLLGPGRFKLRSLGIGPEKLDLLSCEYHVGVNGCLCDSVCWSLCLQVSRTHTIDDHR